LPTKVIIVTGYGTKDQERLARQSPALMGFLHKQQFDVARFRSLVRQVV
jgi:hypothetical protein